MSALYNVYVSKPFALTYEGIASPWSPRMRAWTGDPVPESLVRKRSPLELQGAAVFQYKNCRNCHALEGRGGMRGPDLAGVGARLTLDQLIDQISNGTPGGGKNRSRSLAPISTNSSSTWPPKTW